MAVMLRQKSRNLVKQALWWSRIKLLYGRITLSRFTTTYFVLALVSCILLCSLQMVIYHDNSEASDIVSLVLSKSNLSSGITFSSHGELQFCQDIPTESDADCVVISYEGSNSTASGIQDSMKRDLHVKPVFDQSGETIGVQLNTGQVLDVPCLQSLLWLQDLFRDARREDFVTVIFQLWMFSLSMVTILNESLPHLGASLAGHVLGTAWAAYRVSNTKTLHTRYAAEIVNGTCSGADLFGDWWNVRMIHTIPVIVIQGAGLLFSIYLSTRLFKTYATESFTRVGASQEINQIYKIVLLFSVCLQLVAFFSLAATGLWIDKISTGSLRPIVRHLPLYLAAFAVSALLEFPWIVLGWICVRRECRHRFVAFGIISVFLLCLFSLLFASKLYRFIFNDWPFFATMTLTSYILLVATSFLAVICRLRFGRGLAQYLKVTEVLEGMDFTPVNFTTDDAGSTLKRNFSEKSGYSFSDSSHTLPYSETQKPAPLYHAPSVRENRLSVFSDVNRPTMKLSTTPPEVEGILSSKWSRLSTSTSATGITASSTGSTVSGSRRDRQPNVHRGRSSPSRPAGRTSPIQGLPRIPSPPKAKMAPEGYF